MDISSKHFNLEIATISRCNMACTYCFEGEELQTNKRQTKENLELIVQKIELLLSTDKFNEEYPAGICVNFWGGEPSLNFNWNKDLINTLKDKFYYSKITFFMYSNGYHYKNIQNHLDLFSDYELSNNKFRLQISWDAIDNGRINHKGESTTTKVKNHILTLASMYPTLTLTTKATIQPLELLKLQEIWTNYFGLYNEVQAIKSKNQNRTYINFSPTLNYVDDFDDTNPEYLENLKNEFAKITKYEQAFFDKHHHHLFGWFSESPREGRSKRLTNCTAGINLLAIDYNGNFSSCHGVLYSDKKKDFEKFHNLNLKQTEQEFIPNFFSSREELKKDSNYIGNNCITCEATTCYKCPVVNIEQLNEFKPSNFQVRDTRHCSIYKLFGRFDRLQMSEKLINKG